MEFTFLLLLSFASSFTNGSVILKLLNYDTTNAIAKFRCRQEGTKTIFSVKMKKNDEVMFEGDNTGKTTWMRAGNVCGNPSDRVTEIERENFNNVFELKSDQRSVFCKGHDPSLCSGSKRSTFIGYHNFYRCETAECRSRNLITDRFVIPPLYSSHGLENITLELTDYITLSTLDFSLADYWSEIQAMDSMKNYMGYFISALLKFKKLQIVKLEQKGDIELPSGVDKFILFLNNKTCPRNLNMKYFRPPCREDFVIYSYTLAKSKTKFVVEDGVICDEPISILIFSDKRDKQAFITLLKPELKHFNYNASQQISLYAGDKCGGDGFATVGDLQENLVDRIGMNERVYVDNHVNVTVKQEIQPFTHDRCGCVDRPNSCGGPEGFKSFTYTMENVKIDDEISCEIDGETSWRKKIDYFISCQDEVPHYSNSPDNTAVFFTCNKCRNGKVAFITDKTDEIYIFGQYTVIIPKINLQSDVSAVTCVSGDEEIISSVKIPTKTVLDEIRKDEMRCKIIVGKNGERYCETDPYAYAELHYYSRDENFNGGKPYVVGKSHPVNEPRPSNKRFVITSRAPYDIYNDYTCSCGLPDETFNKQITHEESIDRGDDENLHIIPYVSKWELGCAYKYTRTNGERINVSGRTGRVFSVERDGLEKVVRSHLFRINYRGYYNELYRHTLSDLTVTSGGNIHDIIGYRVDCGTPRDDVYYGGRDYKQLVELTSDPEIITLDEIWQLGASVPRPSTTAPPVTTTKKEGEDEVEKAIDKFILDLIQFIDILKIIFVVLLVLIFAFILSIFIVYIVRRHRRNRYYFL